MQLSELNLDRWGYKNDPMKSTYTPSNLLGETSQNNPYLYDPNSSQYISANVGSPASQYLASGGNAAIDVNNNTPNISGDKIKTGAIESRNFDYISGHFSVLGTQYNLNTGVIISKQFAVDSAGNAYFLGDISGASGTFSGTVSANQVTGGTLTGSTVQTSATGQRVVMSQATNSVAFYDSSGTYVGEMYGSTTGSGSILISATNSVIIAAAAGGVASLAVGSTNYIWANGPTSEVWIAKTLIPINDSVSLGKQSGYNYKRLYLNTVGYVNADGSLGYPWPGNTEGSWTVTHTAGTGIYVVNHPLATDFYIVTVCPVAAAVKMWSITNRGANSFTVRISNLVPTLEDNDFMFTLINSNT